MVKTKPLNELLPENRMQEIDHWIKKFPEGKQQSAVIAALMIVQEEYGYLTEEIMDAVAQYLSMPSISVYEVATFYSMYNRKPVGRHLINVCTNISCKLKNSKGVVEHLEKKLDIKTGQTTKDGRFTLKTVECLGACVGAPMLMLDKDYHENLTSEKIDTILEQYQ